MQKLVELDTLMNECAWRHVQEEELSISDINTLLRTFHNRRASTDSLLFHTIIQKLVLQFLWKAEWLTRHWKHC